MKRNLRRHLNWEAKEGFDWTQWQAIQIKSLRGYREEAAKIIDLAFEKASPETEKFIAEAFHGGAKSFDLQIDKATQTATAQIPLDQLADARLDIGKDGKVVWTTAAEAPQSPSSVVANLQDPVLDQTPDESFFQVNKPKLDACINDTHRDMDQVRFAAANRMGAGYEEILKKADIFMQSGTMTLQQAIDMASREFLAAGLNCVEYEDGRRVHITSYIEMALRASSRRAALTAEGAKRDRWNEHLVVSPTLGSTCPHCQKWQGVVLIDDVYSKGKPDGTHPLLSEAIKDHFLHPNCRHPLVTFFEGITDIPTASPYEQTRTQYEAEKRQRQTELTIRKYKRLRDGSLYPDNQRKYDTKVKEWEGIMKQHLKDYPELRRKPEREKYIPGEPLVATASIRFLNKSDNLFEFSGRIKPQKGFEDVVCHGDNVGFAFRDTAGKETNISANDFADMIKESPDYKGGNIRLITCGAGAEGGLSAQIVSDKLGVTVLAPDKTVYVTVSGEMYICDEQYDILNPEKYGKWLKFSPKGGR